MSRTTTSKQIIIKTKIIDATIKSQTNKHIIIRRRRIKNIHGQTLIIEIKDNRITHNRNKNHIEILKNEKANNTTTNIIIFKKDFLTKKPTR